MKLETIGHKLKKLDVFTLNQAVWQKELGPTYTMLVRGSDSELVKDKRTYVFNYSKIVTSKKRF